MADDQATLELLVEVRQGLANIKQFEAEYKTALAQMAAATKAGMDPASAEFQQLRARVAETGKQFLTAGEQGSAAMRKLAAATGVETAETKELAGKIAIARAELDRFHKEGQEGSAGLVKSFGGIRTAIAAIATSLVAIKVKDFFRGSVEEAAQASDAYAEIERLIKSTGGAAHRTAEQLREAASELAAISVYDDDEILGKTTAGLLRFTKINDETFDRAQRVAVDLAAFLKTDLSTASIAAGKALELPGEGLRVLVEAGVKFTASEIEVLQHMTETGRAAEAQAVILDRLEVATAGAAETYRKTLSGALQGVLRDFDDVQEAFGKGLGKELQASAEGTAKSLRQVRPAAEDAGRAAGTTLSWGAKLLSLWPALSGAVAIFVGGLVTGLGVAYDTMLKFTSGVALAGARLAELAKDNTVVGRLLNFTGNLDKAITSLRSFAVENEKTQGSLTEFGESLIDVGMEKLDTWAAGLDDAGKKAKGLADTLGDKPGGIGDGLGGIPEKADKAGKALATDFASGADKAKKSLEEMAAAARAALEQEGVNSLGEQKKGLEDTVSALKAKQQQGGLTTEEMARLFEAEDELASVSRDLANASREVELAMENMATSTEEARTETEVAQDVMRRYAEVGKQIPGAFDAAGQSLGEFAAETQRAREAGDDAVITMSNISQESSAMAASWTNAALGADELAGRTQETSDAIAGLAERQGVAAAASVEVAAGMEKAAQATAALKEQDPAAYWKLVADEAERFKAALEWINGDKGIDLTTAKCKDLVACLRDAAAAEEAA